MVPLLFALLWGGAFAQSAGSLRGVVVDDDHQPIAGAHVRFERDDGDRLGHGEDLTDADGRYAFDGLPHGVYVVEAHRPGFQRLRVATPVSEGRMATVDLHLEAGDERVVVTTNVKRTMHLVDVPFSLMFNATCPEPPKTDCAPAACPPTTCGTVRGPDGAPMAGVSVVLRSRTTPTTQVTTTTDAGGRYLLPQVPDGLYTVTWQHPGFRTVSQHLGLPLGGAVAVVLERGPGPTVSAPPMGMGRRYQHPIPPAVCGVPDP